MPHLHSNIKETLETETLETLAVKIAQYATEADEQTIEAAKLFREARKRVEAGEAGDITWYSWGPKNIKLLLPRLRELQLGIVEQCQRPLASRCLHRRDVSG